jgi:hypothetical protein
VSVSLEFHDIATAALSPPNSVFAERLQLLLQAAELFNAVSLTRDVFNATSVTDLANTVASVSSWEPYQTALNDVQKQLTRADREFRPLAASVQPHSDLADAVVVSKDARTRATQAANALREVVAIAGRNVDTLSDIQHTARSIQQSAQNLSDISLQVADIIASSGLGGLLYGNLLQLVGNSLVLDDLARSAADVEASASLLAGKYNNSLNVGQPALAAYEAALSRPIATATYSFSSIFPGSSASRCGYTTEFAPNNFPVEGVDALPRFLIGVYAVRLTHLEPDFVDGCQSSIQVTVERDIFGLPGLGHLHDTGTASVMTFYSVERWGDENLYLLDLAKTVDFGGTVGESQPFLLWGSIMSPLQIVDVTPGDSPFAPVVRPTTPQELAALPSFSVPTSPTLALVTLGLAACVCVRYRRRTRSAG